MTTSIPKRRRRRVQAAKWIALTALLIGLPFAGFWLSGKPIAPLLEFPPKEVGRAPVEMDGGEFSWIAFAAYAVFVGAVTLPLLARIAFGGRGAPNAPRAAPFPAWGWFGVALGAAAWALAWNRFEWFKPWQKETFVLLWASYMLVANALAQRRVGVAPALAKPWRYAGLFAASAVFWWSFEYLNRFARNWRYVDIEQFNGGQYALAATLAFSTVLPAYYPTYEWIAAWPRFDRAFSDWIAIRFPRPRAAAIAALVASAAGLAGLGRFPQHRFPLVWVSPVLVVVGVQTLRGRPHVLSGIARGDWRHAVASSAAALVCGVFWEMWNWHSLAKWQYDIPCVGRFHVFEMPLLGYAGYLPFGMMCATVADEIMPSRHKEPAAGTAPPPPAAVSDRRACAAVADR